MLLVGLVVVVVLAAVVGRRQTLTADRTTMKPSISPNETLPQFWADSAEPAPSSQPTRIEAAMPGTHRSKEMNNLGIVR